MNARKHSWLLKALMVLGVLCCICCEVTSSPTALSAELNNLTVCKGRDEKGLSIALPEIISTTEPQICICGDLKVDEKSYLQVWWDYERKDLQDDIVRWENGPVTACITKDDGFEPGNYGAVVIYGKSTLGIAEFTVGEGP